MLQKLWVESYRPKSIADYIFQNESDKEMIMSFIEKKSIPHILLSGHRGTGKTTLAYILKNELGIPDADFKFMNGSDETSIDVIRNEVKSFVSVMPIGEFKVVVLDEADYLSKHAQSALRGIMEQNSDNARFILTCNYIHKIIPEIMDSRISKFHFGAMDKKTMALAAYKVLKNEKVKVESLDMLNGYVDECHPDMRKLLQSLENNAINGVLRDISQSYTNNDILSDIVELLSKGQWMEVRQHIVQSIENDEWDEIYRFLYDVLHEIDGFDDTLNWKQGIVIIADHLRFHGQVADPEINFSACMVRLSGVIK
jgi:replication factor C small subunit